MLKIYCDSARCYLDSSNLDLALNKELLKSILTKLHGILSYEDKNLAFTKMNAKTRWAANINTRISLYSAEDYSFPRGLLTKVVKHFTYYELAHQVIYTNLDKIPQPVSELVIPDWAYSHQVDIVHHALHNKRCVIQSGTGTGKSFAIGWIINQFKGIKTLVVVPKINLAEQMFNGLTALMPDKVIKIVNSYNKFEGEFTDITIAVINSAVNLCNKYADKLQEVGLLVVDEAHRSATESFKTVSNTCVNAEYRVGLTATPLINNLLVQAYVGDLAFVVQDSEMVDKKIIIKPTFISYKPDITYRKTYAHRQEKGEIIYLDKQGRPTFNNKPPYADVYKHSLCLNQSRNNLIVDIVKTVKAHPQRKGPIIVFIEWQDIHGTALVEAFAAQDVKIDAYLNGLTTTQERNQIINNLQKGIYDVVLATNVVSEGTDIISLEYAILCDGRVSGASVIQKIGRVVRKAEGKSNCYVIDIADTEFFYLKKAALNRELEVSKRYGKDCIKKCNNLQQLVDIITVR